MPNELTVSVKGSGRQAEIQLVGKIDENSDYSQLNFAGIDRAILNFDGVTLINSSGIQQWIKFLEGVPKNVKIDFANCPLRIVNQLNLIPAFIAGRDVDVLSFYAPYYCEKCDESQNILLDTAKHFPDRNAIVAPGAQCGKCKTAMEFDGIEKKYFLFMKR